MRDVAGAAAEKNMASLDLSDEHDSRREVNHSQEQTDAAQAESEAARRKRTPKYWQDTKMRPAAARAALAACVDFAGGQQIAGIASTDWSVAAS